VAHILANSAAGDRNDETPSRVGAIIVAAGPARRNQGGVTQDGDVRWAPLAGRPVLAWTVASIRRIGVVDDVVLVVAPDRLENARMLEKSERWEHITIVPAGSPRRRDAVMAGVHALAPTCRWIVVHDAARPLVTPELIAAGLAAAEQTGAASASEPVKETIKRVRDGVVAETLDRSTLVLLQTPQVFERSVLLAIHQQSSPTLDPPDDATLAMLAGIRVATFPGSHNNMAITTPDDIAVAEALLTQGGKQVR
jgi:2-C-methyl-D-erythritol 4-phosphate cytidylyltransferase